MSTSLLVPSIATRASSSINAHKMPGSSRCQCSPRVRSLLPTTRISVSVPRRRLISLMIENIRSIANDALPKVHPVAYKTPKASGQD